MRWAKLESKIDAGLRCAQGLPQQRLRLAFKVIGQILQAELFQVAWTLKAGCPLIVDV